MLSRPLLAAIARAVVEAGGDRDDVRQGLGAIEAHLGTPGRGDASGGGDGPLSLHRWRRTRGQRAL